MVAVSVKETPLLSKMKWMTAGCGLCLREHVRAAWFRQPLSRTGYVFVGSGCVQAMSIVCLIFFADSLRCLAPCPASYVTARGMHSLPFVFCIISYKYVCDGGGIEVAVNTR